MCSTAVSSSNTPLPLLLLLLRLLLILLPLLLLLILLISASAFTTRPQLPPKANSFIQVQSDMQHDQLQHHVYYTTSACIDPSLMLFPFIASSL